MSGSSNSGSGTTTTQVPEWLQQAYQSNVGRAQGIADSPFQAYGGQMAAGDNDYLAAARDLAVGGSYAGRGQQQQASKIFGEVADQSPYLQSAEQVRGQDLSGYTNPYEDQVVQRSLGDIEQQRQRAINASNAATPSGAFGGSRQGVSDALTNEAYAKQSADTAAQLHQQGFTQAQGLAGQDADRRTTNNQFNAGLDNQNTAFNLQGAQGLLGASQQAQNQANTSASLLSSLGGQLQNTQQAGLDANYSQFQQQQQDPLTKQALLNQSVLGIGSNAGSTTTSNSKAKGYST